MERQGTMPHGMETEHLGQLVAFEAQDLHKTPAKTRKELISEMWEVAGKYVDESGLNYATLKIKDDAMLLMNAPFCGEVPICGIEYDQVVPYF